MRDANGHKLYCIPNKRRLCVAFVDDEKFLRVGTLVHLEAEKGPDTCTITAYARDGYLVIYCRDNREVAIVARPKKINRPNPAIVA